MNKYRIKMEDVPDVLSDMMDMLKNLTEQVNTLTQDINKIPKHPLCLEEVAELLHKSRSTIYNLVAAGAIPFHRSGRRLYFYHEEILKWVETNPNSVYSQYLEIVRNHPRK